MQQDLVWVGGYNDEMDDPDALDFTLGTTFVFCRLSLTIHNLLGRLPCL
jgi:hypothetical protein